ncbi:hypothetical protein D9M71_82690 [compost metagenome]
MKSLTVLRIVTAKTGIEAQRKYDELQSNYHLQAQLVSYAGDTGIDIGRYADSEALCTYTEGMTSYVMHNLQALACPRWSLTITRVNWMNAAHLSPSPASWLLRFPSVDAVPCGSWLARDGR